MIERAAIVAEGADSAAVVAWILDHAGEPEAAADVSSNRGLHGPRISDPIRPGPRAPARYVFARRRAQLSSVTPPRPRRS